MNQKLTVALLKSLGFEPHLVTNGVDAVHAAARFRYAAVLMDVEMPVMDGLRATREIRRAEGKARRVPIIALTASDIEGGLGACLAAGMDDRLTKPASAEELGEVLARCGVTPGPADATSGERGESRSSDPLDRVRLTQLVDAAPDPTAFLCELVRLFPTDVAGQVAALREAAWSGAVKPLGQLAQAFLQSCAMLGASSMATLCEELYSQSSTGDLARIEGILAQLEAESQRVCSAMKAELSKRRSS